MRKKLSLDDLMKELDELKDHIETITLRVGFDGFENFSWLDYDDADPDDIMMVEELLPMFWKLNNATHTIAYLKRPIKAEGTMYKNASGRYEVNGMELAAGCGVEFLVEDNEHCHYDEDGSLVYTPYWKVSRLEHSGEDYFLLGNMLVELDGLEVRIR